MTSNPLVAYNHLMQNVLERTIELKAPMERVFAAITDPAEFGKWFSEGVEGDFEVGSQPIIDEGQYGKFRLAIVDKRPYSYFAYRWVSGMAFVPQGFTDDPLTHPNTLVEFFLEPTEAGTRLKVVETGFAELPAAYAEQNFTDNMGGWEYQMKSLASYLDRKLGA